MAGQRMWAQDPYGNWGWFASTDGIQYASDFGQPSGFDSFIDKTVGKDSAFDATIGKIANSPYGAFSIPALALGATALAGGAGATAGGLTEGELGSVASADNLSGLAQIQGYGSAAPAGTEALGYTPGGWDDPYGFPSDPASGGVSLTDIARGANTANSAVNALNSGGNTGVAKPMDLSDYSIFGTGDGTGGTPSSSLSSLFSWLPAVNAGTSLLSGILGSNAAKSAAQTQADAANKASDTNLQMFNTVNNQQAPWRAAGASALSRIGQLGGQFEHQFDANDLNANMAPNYAFQLDQGQRALRNSANLQSGAISGNLLKGLEDYTQNYAQGAYQQAYNNYNGNQTNIFNRLSNIAGLGQTANQATGVAGTALAGNAGTAQQAAGAAQAAGTVGSTNAITGGLNNAASWFTLPSFLNQGG